MRQSIKTLLALCGLAVYCMFGALCYIALEGPAEKSSNTAKAEADAAFRAEAKEAWEQLNLTIANNNAAINAVDGLKKLYDSKIIPFEEPSSDWDWRGSLYFVFTVVTTIGYGTFAPTTAGGQAFLIPFSLVGIFLTGYFMAQVTNSTAFLVDKAVQCCIKTKVEEDDNLDAEQMKKIAYCKAFNLVLMYIFCWFAFAIIYSYQYTLDYGISLYFVFVTLSTIGFGDYVDRGAFFYIYVLFGLALFANFVSVATEIFNLGANKIQRSVTSVSRSVVRKSKKSSTRSIVPVEADEKRLEEGKIEEGKEEEGRSETGKEMVVIHGGGSKEEVTNENNDDYL